ncbi:MAG: ribonuclease P protein subunit [Candidatus Aenigmarchaeota archaeon]|nr:ribonuclease P protein subunit [Candidatus Aenigmarchaeota archaeon]
MRTVKNIVQHEFIGLICRVVKARNKSLEGIVGKIVDETLRTIVIETDKGRKKVMKPGSVFRFKLEGQTVEINGDLIIARPEDRIKKRMRRW